MTRSRDHVKTMFSSRADPYNRYTKDEVQSGWNESYGTAYTHMDKPSLSDGGGSDGEMTVLVPRSGPEYENTAAFFSKSKKSKSGSSRKTLNRDNGKPEEECDLDSNLNRLVDMGKTIHRKSQKGKCYTPATGVREVASGYIFSTGHYGLFMTLAIAAFAAGTIFMTLYLVNSSKEDLSKFQHSWVNVRWHVDGDKKWSHVWDAASTCYGLTFYMAAFFYFAYIFTPGMHLWNFRGFLHAGVFPMQAMDDIFSNIPLVVLILCVSGQDDFFELLYGTSLWALGHILLNVAQSYGFDHHFVPMRSPPRLTFMAGVAALLLFWGTVIASLEYRTSDVKTELNDGARVGIYTGFGLHLLALLAWGYQIFWPSGLDGNIADLYGQLDEQREDENAPAHLVTPEERPTFPKIFPLCKLVEGASKDNKVTVASLKEVVKMYNHDTVKPATRKAQISVLKKRYKAAQESGAPVSLSFVLLQEDWQYFCSKFIMWCNVRWILSFCFKLAVTLSFVLGVALRLKVEANEAKVDA